MRAKSIPFNGTTDAIPMDNYQSPFGLSVQLVITSGTVTLQHTYNDPYNGETLNWINHSDLANKLAGTYDGSYDAPVRAIRITGNVPVGIMTLVQGRQR